MECYCPGIANTIKLIFLIEIFGLLACDPVHSLYLENQTNHQILIQTTQQNKYDTLLAGSSIEIGKCIAHYEPRLDDIDINYLKIVSNSDTVVYPDKAAIASRLEKIGNLDWRIIFKEK